MSKLAIALLLCTFALCLAVGGWRDDEVDDEYVVRAATHASKELSQKFLSPFHTRLYKILKARSQMVVAARNYKMKVIVGLTECKKTEVDYEDIETCVFKEDTNTFRKCDVGVHVDLKPSYKLVYSDCTLASKDELY